MSTLISLTFDQFNPFHFDMDSEVLLWVKNVLETLQHLSYIEPCFDFIPNFYFLFFENLMSFS